MGPDNFKFICDYLYRESGLVLNEEKAYLLENRLMPIVRKYELESVDTLVTKLRMGALAAAGPEIVDEMTTNESLFFRDTKPFEQMRSVSLPYLHTARASMRKLRIWSAAASTGQEAYSIAMVLREEQEKFGNWKIEILGTDLSKCALMRARSGIYSQFEVQRGMSIQFLLKYFSKVDEKWQVNEDLRAMATFSEFNLLHDPSKFGTFDIIFCRNVLIYFDKDTKSAVLNRIARVLATDGVLFLGAAETLLGLDTPFQPIEGLRGAYGLPHADENEVARHRVVAQTV